MIRLEFRLLLGMMDNMGMTFSKEGTWVLQAQDRGRGFGGLLRHRGPPPAWLKEKYGIDLAEEVDELYKEIPIQTSAGPSGRARGPHRSCRPPRTWASTGT